MSDQYHYDQRMAIALMGILLGFSMAQAQPIGPTRLYDGLVLYIPNRSATPFRIVLDVWDLNTLSRAPAELLVKVYDPTGHVAVREVLPDDGVTAPLSAPPVAGWDHEACYLLSALTRGLEPLISWSRLADPERLKGLVVRTFTFDVAPATAGVYRLLLAGVPDHVVRIRLEPDRSVGQLSTQNWLYGAAEMFRQSWLYVPRGAKKVDLLLLEVDRPASRQVALFDPKGNPIPLQTAAGNAPERETPGFRPPPVGFGQWEAFFPAPGAYDDQLLRLEVSDGPNAYLLTACFGLSAPVPSKRMRHTVNAVFAPDPETARILRGGSLEYEGRLFWHGFQIRYAEWLKTLTDEECRIPPGLPRRPGYVSPGSHARPPEDSADVWMHHYPAHRNPQVLNAALREMANGLNAMGPGDHVVTGPLKNLAYEMGCYGFFYHRPAWRILRESDAPEGARGPIREFVLMMGDRLAFARGGELINGNALASLVQALRYCNEATQDPLQERLFNDYWNRFVNGGFGDRVGIGPSGAIQESFGYDHNYGSYVLLGWRAVLSDLHDPRFQAAWERVMTLYSYTHTVGAGQGAWSSRTHGGIAGGAYDPQDPRFRWKGFGGPDLTEDVNGGHEFFAARRRGYYLLTYHGRLSPSWIGDGFQGQVGYGGGMITALVVPARGAVLASTLEGSYGAGMHRSQWLNFHLHTLAGLLPDGQPFVAADSEHLDARLEGNVVTSSGEIRNSSLLSARRYDFREDRIVAHVHLMRATGDTVFDLWGGRPRWRGRVREAWEMIPFVQPPARGRNPFAPTRVTYWKADHAEAELTTEPVQTDEILVDRGGYGVRLRLDRTRTVRRGANDTIMIQVAAEPVEAEQVTLSYELIPFEWEPSGRGASP
jgi:hypothetical protein